MQQAQVVNFDLTPSNKERTKGQTGCIPTKQLDLSSGTEQFLQDSLYDKVRLDKMYLIACNHNILGLIFAWS